MSRLVWRVSNLFRPRITLGVRLMVEDIEGRIVLVRQTYSPGLVFPGGGVDPGETAAQAALREMREEAGLVVEAEPELVGVYLNRALDGRDHVLFYVARGVPPIDPAALRHPPLEIRSVHLVQRTDLPPDTSPSTRQRLAELFDRVPVSADW